MKPQKAPHTLVFLGRELRHRREAAGMTQQQLADAINYGPTQVSYVETAQRMPKTDFTEPCDEVLGTGGILTRLLTELVARDGAPDWFWPWLDIEREATSLRSFCALAVDGLLQEPGYAWAMVRAWETGPDEAVEKAVSTRMERQQILSRDDAPMLVAVMDEGVLHRPVGGAAVMRRQFDHLLGMAALPHVIMQVVPSGTGEYTGLAGSFLIAEAPGNGAACHLETAAGGQTIDQPELVAQVLERWESLRAHALPHRQSIQLIEEVGKAWT